MRYGVYNKYKEDNQWFKKMSETIIFATTAINTIE